jgi:hypothetical protein
MRTLSARSVAIALLGSGLIASSAMALTQTISATVSFVAPLAITNVTGANFGEVAALTAGTYVLTPTGSLSASGGGQIVGGTPQAAGFDIAGSNTQTLNISANGFTASNGVIPSSATCSYNGAASVACNSLTAATAPGSGKRLNIGLTVTVPNTVAVGTVATPSFVMNVVYN